MTLDREDIAALAAELARVLAPLLNGERPAPVLPPEAEADAADDLTDHQMVLMLAQPDPLAAIRAREKSLRRSKPVKGSSKRQVA